MTGINNFSPESIGVIAKMFDTDAAKLAEYSEAVEANFFEYASFDEFMEDFFETLEDYGCDFESYEDLVKAETLDFGEFRIWALEGGTILVMDMID